MLNFRGKAGDTWVYGSYLKVPPYMPCVFGNKENFDFDKETKHLIISLYAPDWGFPYIRKEFEVNSQSIGLCTGLIAKNIYALTNYIYENDILKLPQGDIGIVRWDKDLAKFTLEIEGQGFNSLNKDFAKDCEIIGNTYDGCK